ncbi:MAG TPA: hypothetical protein G4O08_11605 [Anaerolineae bacterium]|nr:hypothetical protein [Anaerolineae bacterium]
MAARRILLLTWVLIGLAGCSRMEASNGFEDEVDLYTRHLSTRNVEREPRLPCPSVEIPEITHLDVLQAPSLPEPEPGVPYIDPVFGTCVVRITDRDDDISPGDSSPGLKNEYSRVQSFNADGSRLLARAIEGTWYLYDAATLAPLGQVPIEVEPRWDSEDPDLLYYFDTTSLLRYNIRTGVRTLVHDFADDLPDLSLAAVWTRYEGSPSIDRRTWGLMAQDQDWDVVAFLVYDQELDEVTAIRRLPSGAEVDSATISPLGSYFLGFFDNACESTHSGDAQDPCGLMVYDRHLEQGHSLVRIIGHSDLALDASGREVLVYQEIDNDTISMVDLDSGEATALWPIDFSHRAIGFHFSGQAIEAPGWILVSAYTDHERNYTWMDNQVFAVELIPGGRVVRLAHTHSVVDESRQHYYWAEPHASVDQNLTRVLFTSNWGRTGTAEVEMFMIELPAGWLDRIP